MQVACVAGGFLFFYFVVHKVRGTASQKLHLGGNRKWWFFSLRSSLARLLPDSFPFRPRFSITGWHQTFPALLVCACLHDILPSKTYPLAWLPRYAAIVNMADTRTRGSSRSPARGVRNRSRSRERERPREREANENKVSIDREKV